MSMMIHLRGTSRFKGKMRDNWKFEQLPGTAIRPLMLRGLRLSPRASVASLAPQLLTAQLQAITSIGGSCRGFRTSPPALGGRNDSKKAISPKLGFWLANQSKKAKKRFKKKQEALDVKAPKSVPTPAGLANKRKALALLKTDREDKKRELRLVIDGLRMQRAPAPSPRERLRGVDVDSLQKEMADGTAAVDIRNFNYIIRALGAQGSFEAAVAVLDDIRAAGVTPDVYTYNALLAACAERRNPVAAWEIIDVMKERKIVPTEATYGSLMQACIRGDDIPEAYKVLALAEDSGLKLGPVLFTQLIVGLIDRGLYEKCWDVFNHMRMHYCEPDEVTFTALINACARCDQVERALNLHTEMKQLSMNPTHITFNALLHATGRSFRHCERTFELFEEMMAAGFAHDVYSFNAALLACSHIGDVNRAKEYMRKMVIARVKPNLVTYNTLITVYARAMGDLNERRKKEDKSHLTQAAAKADGKGLLEPFVPKRMEYQYGSGVVPVTGDEDSVVENLLRDYELRKENKQLTAEQEEMLTTDPNNPVNEEGVPFYDDKVDTVEAGYRPGTSWLKSQLGEARPVDPSPLELAMKSSIIPSDGEALEDDSPLPKFAEAFGEPEDEYEADAMAEYAAMKAKLERRSKSGRVDDRKEAAELLERLPREGSESIDVSSRELSGPKPREWDEEEKELRDSLTAAQAKLMAKYDAMYEVVKSEDPGGTSMASAVLPFLRALEAGDAKFADMDEFDDSNYSSNIEKAVVDSINSDPFFDPKRHADVDPDGLDEMEVIDGIQSRIHEKLQPLMDEIVGTDLSDPDFEDEMLDVLEGPSEKQLQLIGNEDTSLEDDLAQLELDGLEDEEEGSVNSLDGTIASPGEQRPGYVRRKRWAVTSSDHYSAASEETMDATTGLPSDTLKKLHLSEKDLTAPTGIQTAAFPASTQSPSLGELAQVILEDIENSTHVKPSRTSTAAPVSEGLHNRVVTSEGLTVVPVDLPDGLSGDTFQERLVAAGENVAGRRKRLLTGTPSSLMNTLLTLHSVTDKGALPTPATQDNVDAAPEAWRRLSALQSIASKVFGGAHWIPTELPTDRGQLRSLFLQEVSGLYGDIQRSGLTPDAVTVNAMVLALTNANAHRQVEAFVSSEFPRYGVIPCERTYRSFITMLCRAKSSDSVSSALSMIRSMPDQGIAPTGDCYGPVVHALARDYKFDEAFAVLTEAKAMGIVPSEHHIFLLRQRCKYAGVWHESIPAHPLAWQFTKQVSRKRKDTGKRTRKSVQFLNAVGNRR